MIALVESLNAYQAEAAKFAKYPPEWGVLYCGLGLAEEAGEVSGKLAKAIRRCDTLENEALRSDLKKEMGDVLWQLSQLARELGFDLQEVANANLAKLHDRKERGVLVGEGDNR